MQSQFKYECSTCGKVYKPTEVAYLCPDCCKKNTADRPPSGVLKTVYDVCSDSSSEIMTISNTIQKFELLKSRQFIDLLPVNDVKSFPKLNVGGSPCYKFRQLGKRSLNHDLFLKDDSQNPTYSFKDRASALVSAYAAENGMDTIIAASTGNAGSSLAGICASQGQKAIIMVPETAPIAKLTQILMYGATLIPVNGTYDDAFELSLKATETFGWYNRNTAFNPITIEGKKTVVFELFEQLGFSIPERIFVPVGDGVIISGVYKGFEDLLLLKIIDRMPVIVAVQAEGSNNIIRNLDTDKFEITKSSTIADSISVDIPRNFYMTRDYLKKYQGEYISVSDNEIMEASSQLSINTGLFTEPASAAGFAAYLKYLDNQKITKGSENLVLLTGSGLKDIKALNSYLKMPKSVHPDILELKHYLNTVHLNPDI